MINIWHFDSYLNAGLYQNASCNDAFDESVKLILFYFCQSELLGYKFNLLLFTFHIHTQRISTIRMHQLGFWNDSEFGDAFQQEDVRRKFIAKVLIIVWVSHGMFMCSRYLLIIFAFISTQVQLLVTSAFAAFFALNEGANEWIRRQVVLFFVMGIVFFVIQIMLFCCNTIARNVPLNYILLVVATLVQSFITSFICARVAQKQVSTN